MACIGYSTEIFDKMIFVYMNVDLRTDAKREGVPNFRGGGPMGWRWGTPPHPKMKNILNTFQGSAPMSWEETGKCSGNSITQAPKLAITTNLAKLHKSHRLENMHPSPQNASYFVQFRSQHGTDGETTR